MYKQMENFSTTFALSNENMQHLKKDLTTSIEEAIFSLNKVAKPAPLNDALDDSEIPTVEDRHWLVQQFAPDVNKYRLLYRGSRDGWLAADFHSRCDEKGPTITLIKVDNGRRCGGYASESWDSDDHGKTDNESFLFSLDLSAKYSVRNSERGYDMYCYKNNGPCFGGELRVNS